MKIGPITSYGEYTRTLRSREMFQGALDKLCGPQLARTMDDTHPLLIQAQKDSYRSVIREMTEALGDYAEKMGLSRT